MTKKEHVGALALAACRFPPASFAKRFARNIHAQATSSREITEKQALQLAIQLYRFRRQIKPRALVPATPPEGYFTPKQRAAEARAQWERQRIQELRKADKPNPPQEPDLFTTEQTNTL